MIITVIGFKGGIGKTSVAVHLACFLNNCLLVDGDPNRSATGWANRGKLPCNLCDAENAAAIAKDYKNIVIDTKARPDTDDLESIINTSDLLILPTTADALALDALMLMVKVMPAETNYRILLNAVPPKPSKAGNEALDFLRGEMQLPVFSSMIRRYAAYQKASLKGVPVYESGDRMARIAWADYKDLGAEVLCHE
jgi:chromosome partitioning protein